MKPPQVDGVIGPLGLVGPWANTEQQQPPSLILLSGVGYIGPAHTDNSRLALPS